jgi:hypothetical protein
MQSELKKSNVPHATENVDQIDHLDPGEQTISELLLPSHPPETAVPGQSSPVIGDGNSYVPCFCPGYSTVPGEETRIDLVSTFRSGNIHQTNQEPISNPLALLADASDAAQALEMYPTSQNNLPELSHESSATTSPTTQVNDTSLGRQLLLQPGYVSLGLKLDREALARGLDAILAPSVVEPRYSNYFNSLPRAPLRDVGPDIDPVDLGLVTMEEACHLFPLYDIRIPMVFCFLLLIN